ncbi:MAG TPA: ethanolamine ammonia-lyase reactivating factor EutA [Methylophilaceae bacterium]|jgi:ethanolamine utilization protein EutA
METLVDQPKVLGHDSHDDVRRHSSRVYLLGFDIGSTTSSALVASALLSRGVTGRMLFSEICVEYRATPMFTPFIEDRIDVDTLRKQIQVWLAQGGVSNKTVFSGGSIITGLAAQAHNAEALVAMINEMMDDSIIATANEPNLESWLAFMGGCAALSQYHADIPILNFDIGGGTTNVALGVNGDVLSTGCYFIGARHLQFKSGTYQILKLSDYALVLLKSLNIHKVVGETLDQVEREKILQFYIQALEAIASHRTDFFAETPIDALTATSAAHMHQQVGLNFMSSVSPKITFSGGVGELIYQALLGEPLPEATYFGDFGIDLALAIIDSPILSADLRHYMPENKGRATVYGLTLHSTEVSGQTLYLSAHVCLPLQHIPIVAKLSMEMPDSQWLSAFTLAAGRHQGACIQLVVAAGPLSIEALRAFAYRVKHHYLNSQYPSSQTLIVLLEMNVGKTLGQYISDWGAGIQNLIVIDEVPLKHAQFVHIGRICQQMVPVSFYGMH